MSHYWGYKCETCEKISDHWFNHGEEMLARFIQSWDAIKEVNAIAGPYNVEVWVSGWGQAPFSFLYEHEGHQIVLHSEYGKTAAIPPKLPHVEPTCSSA